MQSRAVLHEGRILAANPAACRILGRTETEICRVGRAGLLVDDDRTRAAIVRRAVAGSERAELSMRRGDGEIFTADLSSTVFTTVDGELRASVIFRDIGERVRSQHELDREAQPDGEHEAGRHEGDRTGGTDMHGGAPVGLGGASHPRRGGDVGWSRGQATVTAVECHPVAPEG